MGRPEYSYATIKTMCWSEDAKGSALWVRYSPQVARDILNASVGANFRSIRSGAVARYREDMVRQRWLPTGETIKFYANGLLADGQHRMTACVLADTPFESLTVFGVSEREVLAVDSGSARGAADYLKQFANASAMAASARCCLLYELHSGFVGRNQSSALSITRQQICDYVDLHVSTLSRSVGHAVNCKRTSLPSITGCMFEVFRGIDEDLLENEYYPVLAGQKESLSTHPCIVLRDTLMSVRASSRATSGMDAQTNAILLVTAWNHLRKGTTARTFRIHDAQRTREGFPRPK